MGAWDCWGALGALGAPCGGGREGPGILFHPRNPAKSRAAGGAAGAALFLGFEHFPGDGYRPSLG